MLLLPMKRRRNIKCPIVPCMKRIDKNKTHTLKNKTENKKETQKSLTKNLIEEMFRVYMTSSGVPF